MLIYNMERDKYNKESETKLCRCTFRYCSVLICLTSKFLV